MKYTLTTTPILSPFLRTLAKILIFIAGWKKAGLLPTEIPQFVCVLAPHTSNWDIFILILYALAFDVKCSASCYAKKSIFLRPLRALFMWIGAIPVDRAARENMVEKTCEMFRKHSNMYLVILPDGTRSKTSHWKSGFYFIARQMRIPIVCLFIDYEKKTAGFGPIFDPSTDDIDTIFKKLRAFYGNIKGKKRGYESEIIYSISSDVNNNLL
jgi:1-acyl-sn-glycerol-3-phosphate acyltransferase